MKLKCTFEPQRWEGRKSDYAYPAEPMGEVDWVMDIAEVEELTGVKSPDDLDDDPFMRDELRFSKAAPQWVKDWHGPFEVSWEKENAA